MRIVTKYVSILGREFDNAADARADEDRLPSIIATYKRDIARLKAGEPYAGKAGPHSQQFITDYELALSDYEAKWADVQQEREAAAVTETAP